MTEPERTVPGHRCAAAWGCLPMPWSKPAGRDDNRRAAALETPGDARFAEPWAEHIRTARDQGMEALVQPAISRWFTERFRTGNPRETARIAAMIRNTSVDGWCGCCAAISEVHTTERLHEIECPALVMVGEHDIGTPLAAALDIHRRLEAGRGDTRGITPRSRRDWNGVRCVSYAYPKRYNRRHEAHSHHRAFRCVVRGSA